MPTARPPRPLSILLLAADSGEGALGEFLDPRLRERFAAAGLHFRSCYVSDLRRDWLASFHIVILLRAPVPGHSLDDLGEFRRKSRWLKQFVQDGGSLLAMFTECYGKTEGPLNELLADWGIQAYFNRLEPAAGAEVAEERFPRCYESRILPFHWVDNPCFDLDGGRELGLLVEAGHGTQQLTLVPDPAGGVAWQPLLRGGQTIRSRTYRSGGNGYHGSSDTDLTDPIVAAAAMIGDGRVVLFPASAPFWLVNGYIWRFQGHLLEQRGDAGFHFFRNALRWLGATRRNRRLGAAAVRAARRTLPDGLVSKPTAFSFRPVAGRDLRNWRHTVPRRVWIGAASLEPAALRELAALRRAEGYHLAVPLGRYDDLTPENWRASLEAARTASAPDLQVQPGYELLDDEGVFSSVVSPEVLPRHARRYPVSTLLENVWVPIGGCASLLRTPLRNRLPPQRYGGYNLIEYEDTPEWHALYRNLVASKQFVSPFAVSGPGGRPDSWVLVPPGGAPFDALRRNRRNSFVSDGPLLERFCWLGAGLIDDEWEGLWAGWRPGDRLRAAIRITAAAPLAEVTLWDGTEVMARFTPGTPVFEQEVAFAAWRDHGLHLTARDRAGGRLHATFPLHTRHREFWGHVGSDNMNNYVNPMKPAPGGFLGVGTQTYEMFGFVTLGAAWGDYLRITPSLYYSEFMPRQEISGIIGSFNVHHPSAILEGPDGRPHYLNDHRRVFPFCGADAQAFVDTIAGEHVDNEERAVQEWHGRPVTPTRILLPTPGVAAGDAYVVWRWAAHAQVLVEVRKSFQLGTGWPAPEWLTFASNAHYLLPGLRVASMTTPKRQLPAAAVPLCPEPPPPGKEWDNSHYLRFAAAGPACRFAAGNEADGIEIGNGGAGTAGLVLLGMPRPLRCRLFRTDKELTVFWEWRLRPEERAAGVFTIHYLLAVDATEPGAESAFARTLLPGLVAAPDGRRALAAALDLSGCTYPLEIDLAARFPEWRGRRLYLAVTGLPADTVRWLGPDGHCRFASQAQAGRSWHIVEADAPRRYRLERQPTLEATP